MKDDIFAFIIGEEQTRFNVHISALKSISRPLGVMMTNGKMEESIRRESFLSDVEADTFSMLVEYAYKGLCSIIMRGCMDQAHEGPSFEEFRCHKCGLHISKKAKASMRQYPFCGTGCRQVHSQVRDHIKSCNSGRTSCNDSSSHDTLFHCVVDGTEISPVRTYNNIIHCYACLNDGDIMAIYPRYKPDGYDGSKTSTKCSMKFSSKQYECSSISHEDLQSLVKRRVAEDQNTRCIDTPIAQHAKLYVLASKYLVADIPEICLFKLHAKLLTFEISQESITELVELVLYTYENTSDDGSIMDGTGDKLRGLVIEYVVDRAGDIMQYEEARYQMMVGAEGAPGVDFLTLFFGKKE